MTGRFSRPRTTVLIVEDDILVRNCAVDALHDHGFAVLEAANGPDALRLLEGAHVDAVFTDINMPGEFDGLGLAQRVRQRWPHIAIVITSGHACPDADFSCATFVPKPYVPDSIACLIDEMIARDHRTASGRRRLTV